MTLPSELCQGHGVLHLPSLVLFPTPHPQRPLIMRALSCCSSCSLTSPEVQDRLPVLPLSSLLCVPWFTVGCAPLRWNALFTCCSSSCSHNKLSEVGGCAMLCLVPDSASRKYWLDICLISGLMTYKGRWQGNRRRWGSVCQRTKGHKLHSWLSSMGIMFLFLCHYFGN